MAGVHIEVSPDSISEGGIIKATASPVVLDAAVTRRVFTWDVEGGVVEPRSSESDSAQWNTAGLPASTYWMRVNLLELSHDGVKLHEHTGEARVSVTARLVSAQPTETMRAVVRETLNALGGSPRASSPLSPSGPLPVALQRNSPPLTRDEILWIVIRQSTESLAFTRYADYVDRVLFRSSGSDDHSAPAGKPSALPVRSSSQRLTYPGVDPYLALKAATESFVMVNCEAIRTFEKFSDEVDLIAEEARLGRSLGDGAKVPLLTQLWNRYRVRLAEDSKPGDDVLVIPYLALIRRRLPDVPLSPAQERLLDGVDVDRHVAIVREKLTYPCFLELIWSYWHEEGMLVQAMNHISRRFQNMRGHAGADPLANMEMDPLRPLNNLLWGYVQEDERRLSVARRAHEYEHQYGFSLQGKAVAGVRAVDRRSKFLESFHNLLHRCVQFFRQDDNTTVVADGFPVLNAAKETHYLLAHGAHNQFGDLPSTARQEMLMQQWMLSRPEMREFLGGRVMVPYPEPWMDRVDAMKSLCGWTDVSVVHFHDLATFGEQILLSIRYGRWSVVNDPSMAANWARYWRPEIQGYIHAYRAVTGVDLAADVTDQQRLAERYLAPSVHLLNRMAAQARRQQKRL
ncbi:hypothetical protein [Sorangium sp. So ce1000]|uniref:hypothetical protein n=1 Tax=Sorangium sp. So ce1000 TaxID=3133325 RepID=UPI003F5F05F9